MARVVLDTNIILDYLSAKREHHRDAVNLLEGLLMTANEDDLPVVPAGCLKDAYYILCRHYRNEELVRRRLGDFRQVVRVAELTNPVLDAAFASDEPDLEDGLVRATAELCGAQAIITRDAEAYRTSPVPAMDARTYYLQLDLWDVR